MDIRQKTEKIEIEGRELTINCNFGVLADVQEQYDGNLLQALEDARKKPLRVALTWAAAMINDALDAAGEGKRYTAAQLGRVLPTYMQGAFTDKIMGLVWAALEPPDEDKEAEAAPETATEDAEKN